MFTLKEVKSRVRQQPFQPFRLVTSSGEAYDVMHPDLILVGTREVVVGSPSKKDPTVFDGMHRVSMLHITAMEDLPSPGSKSKRSRGNGKG